MVDSNDVEYEPYAWVYVLATFTGGALAGSFQLMNQRYIDALKEEP